MYLQHIYIHIQYLVKKNMLVVPVQNWGPQFPKLTPCLIKSHAALRRTGSTGIVWVGSLGYSGGYIPL